VVFKRKAISDYTRYTAGKATTVHKALIRTRDIANHVEAIYADTLGQHVGHQSVDLYVSQRVNSNHELGGTLWALNPYLETIGGAKAKPRWKGTPTRHYLYQKVVLGFV